MIPIDFLEARGDIALDAGDRPFCTAHAHRYVSRVEQAETGAVLYRCSVCHASAWVGI